MDISVINLPPPRGLIRVPPLGGANPTGERYGLTVFNAGRERTCTGIHEPREQGLRAFAFYGLCRLIRGGGFHWTEESGWQQVEPGDVILSCRDHPHCYGPFPGKPWVEDMLSFTGPRAEMLRESGILSPVPSLFRNPQSGKGLRRIITILSRQTDSARLRGTSLLEHLLVELHLEEEERKGREKNHRSRMDEIAFDIETDPAHPWTVAGLAARSGLSISQFRRLFQAQFGLGSAQFIEDTRMESARQLLTATNLTIQEVAARCGYPDPYHFSRRFHHRSGIPPKAYRRLSRLEGFSSK